MIFAGSPPSFLTASLIAAKSTTAGTPLQEEKRRCKSEKVKQVKISYVTEEEREREGEGGGGGGREREEIVLKN